ncbi:Heat shock protein ssb1 [Neophaeococcomyces mojaviensis]|uniref:Heat shock protein ssb1 n=1 Tax=Neophaeococcomyces mojaviensis TaxID=3383035 RepID=A0ACC3AEX8_9EURO|nr:Heat shock protein ssb1 [Knufia sp. JES_112]
MESLVLAQKIELFNDQFCESFFDFNATDPQISLASKAALESQQHPLEFLNEIPIYCHEEVPLVLVQDEPPSFQWFLTLPSVADFDRCVLRESFVTYILCMAKPGAKPAVSTGSASRVDGGAVKRFDEYNRAATLPHYVKRFMDDGYEIVHIGLLLLFKISREIRHPIYRVWVLLSEAHYTFRFWTVYRSTDEKTMVRDAEHKYVHLCPWELDKFEYLGLNSHSPLMEKPKGLEMTLEQLQEMAARAKERRHAYMFMYNKKYYAAMKEAVSAAKAGRADLEDPSLRKWLDQHESHRERSRLSQQAVSATVKAFRDGFIDPDTEDEVVQKHLKRHNGFKAKRDKEKVGRELLDARARGELNGTDIDSGIEKTLEAGQKARDSATKHAGKRADGVALCKRLDKGENIVLTAEEVKLVDIGRKEIANRQKQGAKAAKKNAQAREVLQDFESGRLKKPNAEQQELINRARKRKEVVKQSNEKQAAKKRLT